MRYLTLFVLIIAIITKIQSKTLSVPLQQNDATYQINRHIEGDYEDEEIRTNTIQKISSNDSSVVPNFIRRPAKNTRSCTLPKTLIDEIASYQNVANLIYQTVLNGTFKGKTYNDLGYFVDKFGSRIAGSTNLENAIDFMLEKMKEEKLENVHGEDVPIPHWVR